VLSFFGRKEHGPATNLPFEETRKKIERRKKVQSQCHRARKIYEGKKKGEKKTPEQAKGQDTRTSKRIKPILEMRASRVTRSAGKTEKGRDLP